MYRVYCVGLMALWGCGSERGVGQEVEPSPPSTGSTVTSSSSSQPSSGGTSSTLDMNDYGLDARPENLTCVAPDPPETSASASLQMVFTGVGFTAPVWLGMAPEDTAWWYVAEQSGRLLRFANEDAVADVEEVLDIRARVDDSTSEMGLLGVAFHPEFEDNGYVYLRYSASGGMEDHLEHVTRFTSLDGGATLDPATAFTILTVSQPYWNHNGGHLTFGPDGYLYVGWGDGGLAGDPGNRAQDLEDPLGKLLRIDVDGGSPYAIPDTNPFAEGGGLPEIYAWGFRNPWRYGFDPLTGDLWLGDVGQDEWEEVNLVERGGNYGWRIKEGPDCYSPAVGCDESGLIDPVVYYVNGWAASVIAGPVYRGAAFPELEGALLYTDHYAGDIYALLFDPVTGEADPTNVLPGTGRIVVHFAEDEHQEVLMLDYVTGRVYRLERASPTAPSTFPSLLSETGCVDPVDPRQPASGLVPYEPIHPFWSDGADKMRWMAIPEGTRVEVAEDGDLLFPVGTVLMKAFEVAGERVTTRLFMRHPSGDWAGYSYAWLPDGSDATLVSSSGALWTTNEGDWRVPSRAQCVQCHTAASGHSLGLELQQIGHPMTYPSTGRTADQIATLNAVGMLEGTIPDEVSMLPAPGDVSRTLEDRARAYLHVNCASCHQPGASGRGLMDLRYGVSLAASGLCEPPTLGDLGVEGARLVAPGDPERSMITVRAGRRDAYQMPPVGSEWVDEAGMSLLEGWIGEMASCP